MTKKIRTVYESEFYQPRDQAEFKNFGKGRPMREDEKQWPKDWARMIGKAAADSVKEKRERDVAK